MGRLTQDLRAAGVDFDAKKLRPLRKQFRVPYELEYSYEIHNGIFQIIYSGVVVAYIIAGKLVSAPGIKTRNDVRVRFKNWKLDRQFKCHYGDFWSGNSRILYWAAAPHICVEYSQLLYDKWQITAHTEYINHDKQISPNEHILLVQNLLERYHTPFIEEVVAAEIVRAQLPGPIADEICDCIAAVISRRLRGYKYKIYAWNSRECFIQETIRTIQ